MTLEEAKKHLNNNVCAWKHNSCAFKSEIVDQINKDYEAIDTVLKALEDSIPKEKVREKIEQLTENDNLVINEKWDSVDVVCAKREEMAQVDILQELLGERYLLDLYNKEKEKNKKLEEEIKELSDSYERTRIEENDD